jgi:5'-nucleotidase
MKFVKRSQKFLAVLMVLTLILSSFGSATLFAEETGEETVIYILHTNDMHGRIETGSYDGMGFDRIATLINNFKAENDNVIVLDAGDAFHGMPAATIDEGESVVKIMSAMGYQAMAPGNHDFNYGQERLLELNEMAEFPILAANVKVKETGEDFLKPYEIWDIAGLKVGVFGLATPETLFKSHPNNTLGLEFINPVEAAQEMVTLLEPQTDMIIALTHLGLDESSEMNETSKGVAEAVEGIDLIVDGHSHTELEEGLIVNGALIVMAKEYNKYLGVVKVTIDAEGNKTLDASLIGKDVAMELDADPDVRAVIDAQAEVTSVLLDEVVGQTTVKLEGTRENVRTGETNLGNILTDALKWKSGAEAAITNGGGIRTSVEIGEFTRGDIIAVAPFGNLVVSKLLSGEAIKLALENGASGYPSAHGAFAHVSGIKYTIDPNMAVGERIKDVMINGEALDLERMYNVATNDFLAAGGDKYTMLEGTETTGEFGVMDGALIEYINQLDVVAPEVEGRITILPMDEPETATYVVVAGDVLWKIARAYGTTWEALAETNALENPNLILIGQELMVPAE